MTFLIKFKNTFLTPKYSLNILVKFYDNKSLLLRLISRIFWFLPNSSQFRYWNNAEKYNHGYKKFIEMDDLSEKILETVIKHSNENDKILDICCNVGRVLNALSLKGYKNLYGFDINSVAVERSINEFKFDENVKITTDYAESYLSKQDNNKFDVTFSLGASLELIPSHFNLIYHLSRITKKYHICLINEDGHAYPRFWKYEFKKYFSSCNYENLANKRTLFILEK